MELMISGMLVMGYSVAATFFFRFHRASKDRLFSIFGAAFVLLAIQRLSLSLLRGTGSIELLFYGLRLAAFLLIIWAIVDKNARE